jgi:hypothetical protein
MHDPFRHDTYVPLLNAEFTIHFGEDGTLQARLVEVSPLAARGGSSSFSLLFLTEPLDGAAQGLYEVEHPDIGRIGIFLVPVGRTPEGAVQLQAVFNTMPANEDQA